MANRISRLTNNSLRGSENWSQPKSRGQRTTPIQLPKLSIRRLIKRDPADGLSQPSFDRVTDTNGVTGLSGPTGAKTLSKARTAPSGAGVKSIADRGTNKSLKRR